MKEMRECGGTQEEKKLRGEVGAERGRLFLLWGHWDQARGHSRNRRCTTVQAASACSVGDLGSIPRVGRSTGYISFRDLFATNSDYPFSKSEITANWYTQFAFLINAEAPGFLKGEGKFLLDREVRGTEPLALSSPIWQPLTGPVLVINLILDEPARVWKQFLRCGPALPDAWLPG